jgi:hypothetical protein
MSEDHPKNTHLEEYKWKPGQTGNPNGRPPLPKDVKELKKLTQIELEKALNEMLYLNKEQLAQVNKDPESTMLQRLIASIITFGVNKGDHQRLSFLIERLVGKVKDTVELSGKDGGPIQIDTTKLSDEEKLNWLELNKKVLLEKMEAHKNKP